MSSLDNINGSLNLPDPALYRAVGVTQQDGSLGRYDQEQSGSGDDSGSMSFLDIVDVINPLQHIPGVSTIYRELTGDEISPAARIAGGTLYFGPVGLVVSSLNAVVEAVTGDDIGGHFANLFDDDDSPSLAAGDNDPFEVSVGADGELSVDEWLKQPPPGSPEAAVLSGMDPAITGTAAQAQQQIPQSMARTAQMSDPGAGVTLSARPAASATAPSGATDAIALESLPADILAALMSGDPVRPVEPAMGGEAAPAIDPRKAFGSKGAPLPPDREHDMTPDHLMAQSGQMPDDPFANLGAIAVQDVTAYADGDTYGQIASDGGWFTLAMTDAMAKYDNSSMLRQQAQKPFVDVSR